MKNYQKVISKNHRLVAIAFIQNPENKPQVNHINGIKTDNRVENLEWSTHSENQQHAVDTGLRVSPKGEKCVFSKLTEKNVLAIRRLYRMNPKFRRKDIAKKLGVDSTTITNIITRKNWKHI